jgi:hypothetical protein
MIYSTQNEKATAQLSGVYAHGFLETFLGFDVIGTDDLKDWLKFHEIMDVTKSEGVIDTKATNHNGDVVSIRVYLWFNKMPRGIAVTIYDEESIKFAEDHFNKKSFML